MTEVLDFHFDILFGFEHEIYVHKHFEILRFSRERIGYCYRMIRVRLDLIGDIYVFGFNTRVSQHRMGSEETNFEEGHDII